MNPFSSLSIPPTLTLDPAELREIYQNLAAKLHPDQGGDKAKFEALNNAYATLLSPSKRLKAYMEYHGIEHDPRGSISNELMDLFMQVGALVQTTDAFLRKKSTTTSALAKALLEPESMDLQDQLSELIATIESQQSAHTDRFAENPPIDTLPQLARNLAFLEKWHAQLQQRYGLLF